MRQGVWLKQENYQSFVGNMVQVCAISQTSAFTRRRSIGTGGVPVLRQARYTPTYTRHEKQQLAQSFTMKYWYIIIRKALSVFACDAYPEGRRNKIFFGRRVACGGVSFCGLSPEAPDAKTGSSKHTRLPA
jgi:hypothetical protein